MITNEPYKNTSINKNTFVEKYESIQIEFTENKKIKKKELFEKMSNENLFILILKKGFDFHGDFAYAVKNANSHMETPLEAFNQFIN